MMHMEEWCAQVREKLEWALAIHFSQNRMPHMSGDPRNRLSDMQRRQFDQAVVAAMETLTPMVHQVVQQAWQSGAQTERQEVDHMLKVAVDEHRYESDHKEADLIEWAANSITRRDLPECSMSTIMKETIP